MLKANLKHEMFRPSGFKWSLDKQVQFNPDLLTQNEILIHKKLWLNSRKKLSKLKVRLKWEELGSIIGRKCYKCSTTDVYSLELDKEL